MNTLNDPKTPGRRLPLKASWRWIGQSFTRLSTTRTNYWLEFPVDIALILVLAYQGWRLSGGNLMTVFLAVTLGLFFYSFVEYLFHRWLFHKGPAWFSDGHDQHHHNPLGYDSLPFFLPALVSLLLARCYMFVLPTGFALLVACTVTFGYVVYGLGHFSLHHVRFRNSLLRRWARPHHIHHHHPDCNFGVTTPLWDILLGTRYVPGRTTRTASD